MMCCHLVSVCHTFFVQVCWKAGVNGVMPLPSVDTWWIKKGRD